MTDKSRVHLIPGTFILTLILRLSGCGSKVPTEAAASSGAGEPPPTQVIHEGNDGVYRVDHPEKFPLATAGEHDSAPALNVTGVVAADVSRNVPVISLASGRVLEVHARLGDAVTKGQLLLKVQSADISQALSDYQQAVVDHTLTKAQLARSKLLFDKGATAEKDLEVAQDNEAKVSVAVTTTM